MFNKNIQASKANHDFDRGKNSITARWHSQESRPSEEVKLKFAMK